MIEFYTAQTSNGQRAAIMLEECGIAYRLHALDLFNGEQQRDDFLRVNPAGQTPAILLYLAETTVCFLSVAPYRRAMAYQWLIQALSDTAVASMSIFLLS